MEKRNITKIKHQVMPTHLSLAIAVAPTYVANEKRERSGFRQLTWPKLVQNIYISACINTVILEAGSITRIACSQCILHTHFDSDLEQILH